MGRDGRGYKKEEVGRQRRDGWKEGGGDVAPPFLKFMDPSLSTKPINYWRMM